MAIYFRTSGGVWLVAIVTTSIFWESVVVVSCNPRSSRGQGRIDHKACCIQVV